MTTALGKSSHHARTLFVESLWWFLYRTSGFGVEVHADDLAMLYGNIQILQPWLCPQLCPDNAVRAMDCILCYYFVLDVHFYDGNSYLFF